MLFFMQVQFIACIMTRCRMADNVARRPRQLIATQSVHAFSRCWLFASMLKTLLGQEASATDVARLADLEFEIVC